MKVKVKSLSCVQLFVTPRTLVGQTPPALGFPRQEYWTGLSFPSPGDLLDPLVAQMVKSLPVIHLKKAERQRIHAFELWCWRRLLRVPWTARRSNQSIQKEISPEFSLEGLMLKLKLQYFGHLMQRADSLEKTLMLGKIEGGRRRG